MVDIFATYNYKGKNKKSKIIKNNAFYTEVIFAKY